MLKHLYILEYIYSYNTNMYYVRQTKSKYVLSMSITYLPIAIWYYKTRYKPI